MKWAKYATSVVLMEGSYNIWSWVLDGRVYMGNVDVNWGI